MLNQSTILLTALLTILIFVVPKKYFILPFIIGACFVPADQRIIIMDLDFTVLRIVILAGFLRLSLYRDRLTIKWNTFDKIVLIWAICGATVYVLQWADTRALINRCGYLFDIIGLYWLFRTSIHSWDNIKQAIKIFAVCSLLLAVLVGLEWQTGNNPFVVLGRVTTAVREGRYRCQAAFPHSIMLGLFWTTLTPLFVGRAMTSKKSILYWAAVATSTFMVLATASSTPILALLIALIILCGYRWRRYTRSAGWAFLASLIGLNIVMKAPVWHLIARINIVGGSTGWHRYHLIDQAIKHFGEWVLMGCRDTRHWGWGLQDITNQFVLEGVRGGLVTLVLFSVMIFIAVKTLLSLSIQYKEREQQFLSWCLFIAVIGHCISFFGVSYFGQITMLWYMMLAIIGFLYNDKEKERYATIYQPALKLNY